MPASPRIRLRSVLPVLIIMGLFASCASASDRIAAPRVRQAPRLDGLLNDACWQAAATVDEFTKVSRNAPPTKAMTAKACFDSEALYLAFECAEPRPGRIRAQARDGGDDVWKDDCVEVWIRTTGKVGDHDQFIANTKGMRQTARVRMSVHEPGWRPEWRVKARVGKTAWALEMRIPLAALGVKGSGDGTMVEIKFGREDHTGKRPVLTTWPAGTAYGPSDRLGKLYLGDPSHIKNADMSRRKDGVVADWRFGKKDAALYQSVTDEGVAVIRVTNPGRYATASQGLRLKPETDYRLAASAKGDTSIYVRARTQHKNRKGSVAHTFATRATKAYMNHGVNFRTGENGRVLLIVGSTGGAPKGVVHLKSLTIMSDVGRRKVGPAIPVAANASQPTVITKLQVADCRSVLGFMGTPCDGTLNSYNWAAATWEYGMAGGGAGVRYSYNKNNGLHVKLADSPSIDAMVIRGGVRAKLYADCPGIETPAGGRLVWEFPGQATDTRAFFAKPVKADRLSFFDVSDGIMGDMSFFRIRRGLGDLPKPTVHVLRGKAEPGPMMAKRFGKKHRVSFLVAPALGDMRSALRLPEKNMVHFMTEAFTEETPLAAVGFSAGIGDITGPTEFTVRVQDPITPRLELCGPDMVLSGPGRLRVVLDFADQIIPKGHRLWVSLAFQAPVTLMSPRLELYQVARERALPGALAHRLFLMKSFFACASEARRWGRVSPRVDIEKFYREDQWGRQIKEVFDTADHLAYLDPKHDLVRQYQWVYYRRKGWPAMPARIDKVPGAPAWAILARQAWLIARRVPKWWIDHRLAPSGEFGGLMNDDTDMYQNYVSLPYFENDGVAAEMLAGARNLAELAQKENLRDGLNRRSMDPLHAYEEGVNHDATMALWHYGDPVYFERCLVNARATESLTVKLPDGRRHFKSQTVGAEGLRRDRALDRDGYAHPLMWHPTFMVLWYNRNPRAMKHVREWADTWMKIMEPGKYATMVDVKSGKVLSTDNTPFGGGYGAQAAAFLFLYDLTGDEKYVAPLVEVFKKGERARRVDRYMAPLWQRLDMSSYRKQLPAVMANSGSGRFVALGDMQGLLDSFKRYIGEYQYYPIIYTSSELFTDRVFLYGLIDPAIAYTGGFASRNSWWHTHAVGWAGFGTDYAALVSHARNDHFKTRLYSFADEPMKGTATFWRLDHGVYRLTLGPDLNGDGKADRITRSEEVEVARATVVPVELPPKTQMVMELKQVRKLAPIWDRADLALSAREIHIADGVVRGVAHNIGAKAAASTVVALVDANGRIVARKDLGRLDAPLDLKPKRVPFALKGLSREHTGWSVVIDPGDALREIHEGNNAVRLPADQR